MQVKIERVRNGSVAALVLPGVSKDPGGKGSLSEWLPDSLWGKCKGLEEGLLSILKISEITCKMVVMSGESGSIPLSPNNRKCPENMLTSMTFSACRFYGH